MSKIITAMELENLSLAGLQTLHRKVHQELARSPQGSAARRNALASLETISRAMNARRIRARKNAPGP